MCNENCKGCAKKEQSNPVAFIEVAPGVVGMVVTLEEGEGVGEAISKALADTQSAVAEEMKEAQGLPRSRFAVYDHKGDMVVACPDEDTAMKDAESLSNVHHGIEFYACELKPLKGFVTGTKVIG